MKKKQTRSITLQPLNIITIALMFTVVSMLLLTENVHAQKRNVETVCKLINDSCNQIVKDTIKYNNRFIIIEVPLFSKVHRAATCSDDYCIFSYQVYNGAVILPDTKEMRLNFVGSLAMIYGSITHDSPGSRIYISEDGKTEIRKVECDNKLKEMLGCDWWRYRIDDIDGYRFIWTHVNPVYAQFADKISESIRIIIQNRPAR